MVPHFNRWGFCFKGDRMPFAGFIDFDDCVRKNQGKDDPEAF